MDSYVQRSINFFKLRFLPSNLNFLFKLKFSVGIRVYTYLCHVYNDPLALYKMGSVIIFYVLCKPNGSRAKNNELRMTKFFCATAAEQKAQS